MGTLFNVLRFEPLLWSNRIHRFSVLNAYNPRSFNDGNKWYLSYITYETVIASLQKFTTLFIHFKPHITLPTKHDNWLATSYYGGR